MGHGNETKTFGQPETLAGDLRDDDSGLAQADDSTGQWVHRTEPNEAKTELYTAGFGRFVGEIDRPADAERIVRMSVVFEGTPTGEIGNRQ